MKEAITIKGYDRERGQTDFNLEGPKYYGIDFMGKHYIVKNGMYSKDFTFNERGLGIPKHVYEVTSYNKTTEVAKAIRVKEPSLIEKIAVELHVEGLNSIESDREKEYNFL